MIFLQFRILLSSETSFTIKVCLIAIVILRSDSFWGQILMIFFKQGKCVSFCIFCALVYSHLMWSQLTVWEFYNSWQRYQKVSWEVEVHKISRLSLQITTSYSYKHWRMLIEENFFGKVAHPLTKTLSKNWTQLQVHFNWFVYILGAPRSK